MKKILTIAAAGALAFAPASKIALTFDLEAGKTYKQTVAVSNTTKQTAMGQEMEFSSATESVTYFKKIEGGSDGNTYELWYGDMSMEFTGMGQSNKFSSTDTSEGLGKFLGKMTREKFTAVITPRGDIESVSGLEELVQRVADESEGDSRQVAEQMSESMGDLGLKRNLEFSLGIFPEGKVKPGDSWKREHYTSTGMPIKVATTYTLKEVNGDRAVIALEGTFSTDDENAEGELQGMDATFFFDGTRKGTLTVEAKTGWVISGKFEDDIAGSVTVEPNAMVPDGMTVPMELINETVITGE